MTQSAAQWILLAFFLHVYCQWPILTPDAQRKGLWQTTLCNVHHSTQTPQDQSLKGLWQTILCNVHYSTQAPPQDQHLIAGCFKENIPEPPSNSFPANAPPRSNLSLENNKEMADSISPFDGIFNSTAQNTTENLNADWVDQYLDYWFPKDNQLFEDDQP